MHDDKRARKFTADEIVGMIELELQKHQKSGQSEVGISAARCGQLERVKRFLQAQGFPRGTKEFFELSLHPFYFQEVNYDDLDPFSKNGQLGHLVQVYQIDLAVQTGGQSRDTVSVEEYSRYSRNLSGVVAWRLGRTKFLDRLRLLVSRTRKSQ